MNGRPIPVEHGGPVRVIVPGWYAMDSVKWLAAIHVVTSPFDGPFQAIDYRWHEPGDATGPGTRIAELSVHSLITWPADGEHLRAGVVDVRGVAWAPGVPLDEVAVRKGVEQWRPATIVRRSGRYGMTHWHATVELEPGSHSLSVRATDRRGAVQPTTAVPNVGGYCTNAVHRVAVTAETR
jgi:sulfite oxidase